MRLISSYFPSCYRQIGNENWILLLGLESGWKFGFELGLKLLVVVEERQELSRTEEFSEEETDDGWSFLLRPLNF